MSSFLLNPYIYSVGGITRIFYDSPYTASRSTTTSTASINVSRISGVNSGSRGLAVFYQGTTDINNATFDVRLNLVSGATTVIGLNMEPQDTTDRFSMGGAYFDLSETNGVFSSSFSPETSSFTAGYAGYSLVALQLTASDSGSINATNVRYRDPGFVTHTSVPLPAGTYIIVGSAAVNAANTTLNGQVRMFDGTTAYGLMDDVFAQDTTNYFPYWHMFRRTITGTTTFSLQGQSVNGDDMFIRQASIIALNTAQFSNVYYQEKTGSFSTTSTAYTTAMTASFTIANPSNKHLLLAAAMLSGSSTADSFACRLRNTTTLTDYIPEHLREMNATSELYSTVVCRIVTFSGASNSIDWEFNVETAGSRAHIKDMTVAVLDLGTT
jgi:hypothetical protein